jgi:hypothetical protein
MDIRAIRFESDCVESDDVLSNGISELDKDETHFSAAPITVIVKLSNLSDLQHRFSYRLSFNFPP